MYVCIHIYSIMVQRIACLERHARAHIYTISLARARARSHSLSTIVVQRIACLERQAILDLKGGVSVALRVFTYMSAYVSMCQHTPAYASIRQNTSAYAAYISIRRWRSERSPL